jgi:hypothetical protein
MRQTETLCVFFVYSDPMRPLFLPIKLFTVPLCVRFKSFEFSWFSLFFTRRGRNSREYSLQEDRHAVFAIIIRGSPDLHAGYPSIEKYRTYSILAK